MKKLLFIIAIAMIFTAMPSNALSEKAGAETATVGGSFRQPGESKEDLYHDIFISLLNPYINEAVFDFYKEYLTYPPSEDPWFVEILDIERPQSFQFVIKLEAGPYIGPHNSVGIDHLTFRINASGKVTLEKFEHIKSFDIAPNYKSIIKKWPPK